MLPKNKTSILAEPGKQELFITREFNAPRTLVFRAFTDPDLLVKWMGPRSLSTRIDILEPGSGGRWRFVHADAQGNEFGFHGVCHEEWIPERLIRTFEFEGLPETGYVALETARFTDLPDGRTRVVIQSVFQSVEDRDGMVASGMEAGVVDSHERMDELLASLSQ